MKNKQLIVPIVGGDENTQFKFISDMMNELMKRKYEVLFLPDGSSLSNISGVDYEKLIVFAQNNLDLPQKKIEIRLLNNYQEVFSYRDLICIVADHKVKTNVPQYALDEIEEIADLIESEFGMADYL